jgi:hypothetical protein
MVIQTISYIVNHIAGRLPKASANKRVSFPSFACVSDLLYGLLRVCLVAMTGLN